MGERTTASIYDRPFAAALYDLDVRLTSRHLWGTSVADQVVFAGEVAGAVDGGRVLDVPVGTGLVMDKALASTDPRPFVVAADRSIATLRRARRRLGDRAVYVVADVGHLPFASGAFAAVHSGNGFHLFPDRARAAAELARTVEPGGLAAITTWTSRGEHGVRYVVIGGMAVELHQVPVERTVDIDITPAADDDNLDRLSTAINTLNPRIRAVDLPPEGLPIRLDRAWFAHNRLKMMNLVTDVGAVDISFRPQGTDGYDGLAPNLVLIAFDGVDVPVASLEDVARSKEAAGRAKDFEKLPAIERALRERRSR